MFEGFSHDKIVKLKLSRQTYINMNIADSIKFYFNFGKGHYFVIRVKKHFDKARFFKMSRVIPAIVN